MQPTKIEYDYFGLCCSEAKEKMVGTARPGTCIALRALCGWFLVVAIFFFLLPSHVIVARTGSCEDKASSP